MKQKYLILFSLSGLILCCDQFTKQWVRTNLVMGERHELFPFATLVYTTNSGFAFGLMQKAPSPLQNIFLIGLPAFALILIILIFIKLQDNQMMTSLALTSILGGALGNLIDRMRFGYVIDFLDLHFLGLTIPAFNLADASILAGLLLMFYSTLRPAGAEKVKSNAT